METTNTMFYTDFYAIPLGGCEAVLGLQWMQELGKIELDVKNLVMEFTYGGKRHVLRGSTLPRIKTPTLKHMQKHITSNVQLAMIQPLQLTMSEFYALQLEGEKTSLPADMTQLLGSYADVFETPKDLPPFRPVHDHQIHLKPGAIPVNKRPYRYPMLQKDVIETMTQELLETGVIQNSTSPYASPVVLVKKKDGTWRMCVDYKELNKV